MNTDMTEDNIYIAWDEYKCSNPELVNQKIQDWYNLELPDHICDVDHESELCDECHQILVDFLMGIRGRRHRTKVASYLLYYECMRVSVFDTCHELTDGGLDTIMEIFDVWQEKEDKRLEREQRKLERELEQEYNW